VSTPMWGRRVRRYGRRARRAGQHLRRVASQAPEAARRAGRATARHVVSIQRAAGLEGRRRTRRLMELSFWSVVGDHGKGPAPSPDWQQGYAEQAVAMVPALRPAPREPLPPEPVPPEPASRPTWPRGPAKDPGPEDPEAGS
jgi:hypothetical protein